MTVSTIFLQTTNEGENEYGDTTFAIHVPAQDKAYKLSVASFMFRPHIVLMDTGESMTLRLTIERIYPDDYGDQGTFEIDKDTPVTTTFTVEAPVKFNPSKTDVTEMKELFSGEYNLQLTAGFTKYQGGTLYHYYTLHYHLTGLQWTTTVDNRLQLTFNKPTFNYDDIVLGRVPTLNPEHYLERDDLTQLAFRITDCELIQITPQLSHFTGLHCNSTKANILLGTRVYNPQYWNYITLSCNKAYNTGNIVNQERFNSDIDESSQFYKGQILAYMPNNAYAPEAMQTGMATANEYIIQPADFNSIRFWLNYDNGEPVKLCSPMTIVLNMMPNQ